MKTGQKLFKNLEMARLLMMASTGGSRSSRCCEAMATDYCDLGCIEAGKGRPGGGLISCLASTTAANSFCSFCCGEEILRRKHHEN